MCLENTVFKLLQTVDLHAKEFNFLGDFLAVSEFGLDFHNFCCINLKVYTDLTELFSWFCCNFFFHNFYLTYMLFHLSRKSFELILQAFDLSFEDFFVFFFKHNKFVSGCLMHDTELLYLWLQWLCNCFESSSHSRELCVIFLFFCLLKRSLILPVQNQMIQFGQFDLLIFLHADELGLAVFKPLQAVYLLLVLVEFGVNRGDCDSIAPC